MEEILHFGPRNRVWRPAFRSDSRESGYNCGMYATQAIIVADRRRRIAHVGLEERAPR